MPFQPPTQIPERGARFKFLIIEPFEFPFVDADRTIFGRFLERLDSAHFSDLKEYWRFELDRRIAHNETEGNQIFVSQRYIGEDLRLAFAPDGTVVVGAALIPEAHANSDAQTAIRNCTFAIIAEMQVYADAREY